MDFKVVVAEILGTFIFFSVILKTAGTSLAPISIPIGLLASIYIFGNISGGHFNPGVSIMQFFKNEISFMALIIYISSQIIGALLALLLDYYVPNPTEK